MSALCECRLIVRRTVLVFCFAMTETPVKVRLNSRLSHYARVELQLGQSLQLARLPKASLATVLGGAYPLLLTASLSGRWEIYRDGFALKSGVIPILVERVTYFDLLRFDG